MTPDQRNAINFLRRWGWHDVHAVGSHFVEATVEYTSTEQLDTGSTGQTSRWCAAELVKHGQSGFQGEPYRDCNQHLRWAQE